MTIKLYDDNSYIEKFVKENSRQYEEISSKASELIQTYRNRYEQNEMMVSFSGGKDSTVAAALCAKALGAENVIGVAMPDLNQGVNDAKEICEYLGIQYSFLL